MRPVWRLGARSKPISLFDCAKFLNSWTKIGPDLFGLFCHKNQVQNHSMIDGSAVILHRTNSAKNMRRFHRPDAQPDLFGQWCFIREWGRLGHAEQVRTVPP
jgi:hypothetical protein